MKIELTDAGEAETGPSLVGSNLIGLAFMLSSFYYFDISVAASSITVSMSIGPEKPPCSDSLRDRNSCSNLETSCQVTRNSRLFLSFGECFLESYATRMLNIRSNIAYLSSFLSCSSKSRVKSALNFFPSFGNAKSGPFSLFKSCIFCLRVYLKILIEFRIASFLASA